jgi:hypothetical protein
MSIEIIQSVAYDIHNAFPHVNFIFSQICISLFWDYLMMKPTLR